MRCKYMNREEAKRYKLPEYPSFSATGSISGMKKLYYGQNALLVRSGSWIYNVPQHVYNAAH